MPQYKQELETEFSKDALFDLVMDIEKYPEFLPWCVAARIISKENNSLLADLVVSFKGMTERYRSKVIFDKKKYFIEVKSISGPFKYLDNKWEFLDSGTNTKVIFNINFAFNSGLLNKLIGVFFEKATAKMATAFINRAEQILGGNA